MGFECIAVLDGHLSSINCIDVIQGSNIFVSGSADATVKIWRLSASKNSVPPELVQTILINPRFFPLALALGHIGTDGSLILAVAGTKSIIQIYVTEDVGENTRFSLQATLTGHEGWIRSLAFIQDYNHSGRDLLLASASQDKYIRLWRVHQGEELPAVNGSKQDPTLATFGKSLSNKAHRLEAAGLQYSLTFEALLLGHEDWIYTVSWRREDEKLQLLSASADNSLAIWESDSSSGVWVCTTRLGEISSQKGSTTATGSSGGFWMGLWSPQGDSVVSLGRTGSWRLWNHDREQDQWIQNTGVSGHVKDVMGIAWAKDGSYLLSTGSDQTTRLHAEWKRGTKRSWHEFARPQIHGYDLNCVDTCGESQFISGADEKLLRVFDEPRAIADLLERLCGISRKGNQEMPETANIPVLGLSNKAVEAIEDERPAVNRTVDEREAPDPASVARKSTLDIDHPPLEDHLARHTLWPEREKLYGHGYEISAVATSHDGTLVATACKASAIDHAVIRLYETREWHEVKPPLTAHSLTVTCLRFSDDDAFLLSVGRDRQWAVFERDQTNLDFYRLKASNPKGHSRMILGASWAPSQAGRTFATAGRDKSVKLWTANDGNFECKTTISAAASVTAVDFVKEPVNGMLMLAIGIENGDICLYMVEAATLAIKSSDVIDKRWARI